MLHILFLFSSHCWWTRNHPTLAPVDMVDLRIIQNCVSFWKKPSEHVSLWAFFLLEIGLINNIPLKSLPKTLVHSRQPNLFIFFMPPVFKASQNTHGCFCFDSFSSFLRCYASNSSRQGWHCDFLVNIYSDRPPSKYHNIGDSFTSYHVELPGWTEVRWFWI